MGLETGIILLNHDTLEIENFLKEEDGHKNFTIFKKDNKNIIYALSSDGY